MSQSARATEDFSYKEVSEISEATEDMQVESIADEELNDLDDYDLLIQATQKHQTQIMTGGNKVPGDLDHPAHEQSDEFLRNFFIKFKMQKTLDQFQTEWYELKALNLLETSQMPEIPSIY